MNLLLYIAFSAVYIMLIHFAISIKKEFSLFLMVTCFVLSGVVGYLIHSYESGFALGVILTLVFW